MAESVQPGDWVAGPFWEAAVQVVGLETRGGYDVVTVAGRNQGPTRTCVLTPTDWEQIARSTRADRRHIRFSGDASRFRLAIQAHRLRLAHSIDPYAALNASRIDPLPHQTEAVQSQLLAYDLEAMDIETDPWAVLLRPAQVNALYPPVTADEVARLIPVERRLAVQDLYQRAVEFYGAERVAAQGLFDTVGRCVSEGRFGYPATTAALVQAGSQLVAMDGYVGQPELPPSDTRLIRLHGTVTPVEMANVMKTAIKLSKLVVKSSITLDLKQELNGDVNKHSVHIALRDSQTR